MVEFFRGKGQKLGNFLGVKPVMLKRRLQTVQTADHADYADYADYADW